MKIGILGGGQLARMLMLAGYPLGLEFVVLDPAPDACASQIAETIRTEYDDRDGLKQLAARSSCVTFEFENVPDTSIQILAERLPVFPPAQALRVAQDRLTEKTLFRRLGIPTPGFKAVNGLQDLEIAVAELGLPIILKTRRLGYDGKGQFRIESMDQIAAAFESIGQVPLIAEQFIDFQREVSIIAVRGQSGETRYYPLSENTHRNGILSLSICRPGDSEQSVAEEHILRILNHLEYVGILALELFERDGVLLANEIAPRVHNSGHWTIEGAEISQFENHIRAVAGLPLGSTAAKGYSAMVNFVGELPDRKKLLALDEIHFHDYAKTPRVNRKVGHATVNAREPRRLSEAVEKIFQISSARSESSIKGSTER